VTAKFKANSRPLLTQKYSPLELEREVRGFWEKNQILQKLDLSLTSHMFRYGAAERLYIKGYDTKTIMDIGDWTSPTMPLLYAKRKGISPAQRRFSKDIDIV